MGYRSVVVATMSAALLTLGTVGSPEAGAQLLRAPTLAVTPTSGYAGDGVSVTGTCPVESGPVETVPEETVPEETVPEETVPEETVPEETVPEETVPEETVPEETAPEETAPEESGPLNLRSVQAESVQIFFGDTSVGSATVDSSTGEFATTFTVPQVAPGSYGVSTSCEGYADFEVLAPIVDVDPTLVLDPTSGYAGDGVSATGTCPVNSGSVQISFGNTSVGSATVDSSTGAFGTTITVPQTAPGSYNVSTSCEASAGFEVLPTPVVVDPTLVLDPTRGYAGDGVSATGTCPVNSGSVEIFFGDTSVGSATVDSSTGAFGPVGFLVPDIDAGSYDVRTSCKASAGFEVLPTRGVVDPTLVLDPTSGYVGDEVTATGTCPVDRESYRASNSGSYSESVQIFFEDTSVGSATVDSSTGEFGTTFTVPQIAPGSYDVTTDCGGEAPFEVKPVVDPTLVLNPTSGYVGDGVTATGTCPVDSGSVEILFDGDFVDFTTVDPSTGEFGLTFMVPDVSPRSYVVTTDCGAEAPFEVVEVPPTLQIDPASGHVGDDLAATGTCRVREGSVGISFGNTFVGYVTVDSSTGEFGPVAFPVPDVPLGLYDVTTDCGGRAPFEVLPVGATLELDPDAGHVGDGVSATGTCPVDSESVEIFFAGEAVGSESVNSSTGEFGSVDFDVPVVELGSHDVTTDCGGRASFAVVPVGVIPATLELDPAKGKLGVDVTASGTCPLDHPDVTLFLDGRTVATTGGDLKTGDFEIEFPMLGVKGPTHTVTTSCGASEKFTLLFPSPSTKRPGPGANAGSGTSAGPDTRGRPDRPRSQLPTPTPVDTPQGPRIIVPDLTGLTEDEVITALGDLLTLVDRTGGPGVVTRQLPLAGTPVEPASEVSVLLAEAEQVAPISETSRFPLAVLTVLVGALIGALLSGERARRRRARERHWVDTDVRTELETAEPAIPDVPDGAAPGLDVRLELHRDPKHL
jgi:hypothetical protein